MSERDGYPHGVPCWVTCLSPDVETSMAFYGRLFGWSFDSSPGGYAVALLRGREVAGIGPIEQAGEDATAAWITEVRVDDADRAAQAAVESGGRVLDGPMDLSPASILVVLADPAGAVLCASQDAGRSGAQLVNEPGAWSMSSLTVPDLAAVEGFYQGVFGWQRRQSGPACLWRLPGYVGGEPMQPVSRDVIAVGGEGAEGPGWGIDLWTGDVDAAADAASDAGGAVLEEPADVPGLPFRSARLADPFGASFTVSRLML